MTHEIENAKSPGVSSGAGTVVETTVQGRVSIISMVHRPHNLLGPVLLGAVLEAMEAARAAGSTAVVLKSGLRHFSAGAELGMFEEMVARKGEGALAVDCAAFLREFEQFPLPVVASVHGVCVGGGFELATACDYIVASKTSKIGSVEVSLGLHPLMGAIQRVAQRAGALRAKEMALLGRRYDPETLAQWGLINLVTADENLEAATLSVAQELAHGPTIAHTATKRLVRIAVNDGVAAADEAMCDVQRDIWKSADFALGLAAYRETGTAGKALFKGN